MATLNDQQPGGIGGFDLANAADRVTAYDYDGTGKLDHLVCYRPGTGAIFILKKAGDEHSPGAFAAVYHQGDPGQGIGSYNLADSRDRVFAFDYDGTGKLDHLVCYRPGTGNIAILKKVNDSDSPDAFSPVYHQGDPGQGIAGYNLADGRDRLFAFDYDGTGKLDHLVCYRPGTGTIWILKKISNSDSADAFAAVYHQGDPGTGIGGFDLGDGRDRVFAFDYDGTGKLDHLACYRPGTGAIFILKKVSNSDSADAFAAVYHQGDPGAGIGGFDLGDGRDRIFAFDYDGTGKLDHLVCYRPGAALIRILKKVSDNDSPDAFAAIYHQGDPSTGIGDFDLGDGRDRLFAFDYGGTGKLDHLVCYRPGTGMIRILKKTSVKDLPDAFLPVYPTLFPVYPTPIARASALFAALPDQNANLAANAARAALINRLKGCTPGAFESLTFRNVFFASFAPDPNAGSITPVTGLGDDWWTAFSVAVICQAIYYVTSNTRNAVRQPDVNNQVAASNGALQSAHINLFYAVILAKTPGTSVQAAFAQITASDNRAEAARIYVSLLENPAWISAKIGQAASGQWTDQLWELLHHWLKLYALGMTPAQIDAVINALVAAGLPVPSNVGAGNWPSCALWINPKAIDWNDIHSEVTVGMLDFGQSNPDWTSDYPNDGETAARSFLYGQGVRWWNGTLPSSGSCFAAGAKVLMADSAFKNIEAIRPGEMVQSITGPRAVITAVSLRHQGDRLYSFAGTDMRFSATHPFLTHAGASGQPGPATAGVEPTRLMRTMPGLSARGVAGLGPSSPPLAGFAGGVQPIQPGALQERKVTPGAEMVYDLVTAFDAQGESHYCVGDGHTTFAVTSETARFATAPAAATAITDIMAAAWPSIARAMQPVAAAQWHRVLDRALRSVAFRLFPTVAIADTATVPHVMPEGWSTGPYLAANAHGLAAGLIIRGLQTASAVSYDNDQGACLAAIVAVLGNLVRDAVTMGWRVFLGADATEAPLHAISALSFEVVADAAPRGAGALTAEMVVGEGTSATRHALPAFPSNGQPVFFHQIADVAYLPRLVAKPGAPIPVRVIFHDGSGKRLSLHGVTWLPDMTRQTYRHISVPLFETEGMSLIVGQFLIDLRAADDASRAAETAAHAAWTPDKATQFAHALGQRIGARLVAQFPEVVIAKA